MPPKVASKVGKKSSFADAVNEPDETEEETLHGKLVTIKVVRALNVCTAAGEAVPVTSCVSYQFLNRKPVASDVIEHTRDPEYKFTKDYKLILGPAYLDAVVEKTFDIQLLQVTEDGDRALIGIASINLRPLLFDSTEIAGSFPVKLVSELGKIPEPLSVVPKEEKRSRTPISKTPTQSVPHVSEQSSEEPVQPQPRELPAPELQVVITAVQTMAPPEDFEESNVVEMEVGSLFAIPQEWRMTEKEDPAKYAFTHVLKGLDFLFVHSEVIRPPGWQSPETKKAEEKKAADAKKQPAAKPAGKVDPKKKEEVKVEVVEEEKTDEPVKEETPEEKEAKFFLESEDLGQRITWNSRKRAYRGALAMRQLETMVRQAGGAWLEIERVPKLGEPNPLEVQKNRGKVWVDLTRLLEPGQTTIEGRFYVRTEAAVLQPEAVVPVATSTVSTPSTAPKQSRPGTSQAKDATVVGEPVQIVPIYENAKSYITFKLVLEVPLVPLTPPRPPLKPSDLIPARKPAPKFTATKDVTDDFNKQVQVAVEALAEEYRKTFGEELQEEDASFHHLPEEELQQRRLLRRQKFVYDLTTNGQYHLLKEKLKQVVVQLIKEKFRKSATSAASGVDAMKGLSHDERDRFYSELFVFLIEQMHRTLNTTVDLRRKEIQPVAAPVVVHADQSNGDDSNVDSTSHAHGGANENRDARLLRLSKEAEMRYDFTLAQTYHEERFSSESNKADPTIWFDFAQFCLRSKQSSRAEECLKEALSLQADYNAALVMYSCLLSLRERFEQAEAFLRAALDNDSKNILYVTLLALMYSMADEEPKSRKAFALAKRLLAVQKQNSKVIQDGEEVIISPADESTLWLQAAEYLLESHIPLSAAHALSKVDAESQTKARYLTCRGRCLYQQEDFENAKSCLREAVMMEPRCQIAWAVLGHVCHVQDDADGAVMAYTTAIAIKPAPKDAAVFLRLGQIYLQLGDWANAKAVFLSCCEIYSLASSWLGAGIACLRLEEFAQAEESFSEANLLDHQNPDIWGYLTIFCLSLPGRAVEADQAFKAALKHKLCNTTILIEIAERYLAAKKPNIAEGALRRALQIEESVSTRVMLAQVLVSMGREDSAVIEYEQALEQATSLSPETRAHVLTGFVQLLEGMLRHEDARRYRRLLEEL
eukprot:GILJ01003375.1.p1 GENE.GILJ01003375.1~~GILJ01003375.1.p1  ORF type:complete len:1158 (-),score=187.10 GILJ01003375.1:397-3870(-)